MNNFEKPVTNLNIDTKTIKESAVLDLNNKFKMFDIKISRGENNKNNISYFDIDNLHNTQEAKLMIDGEPVELPTRMLKKLASFLKIKHELRDDFDCRGFVNMMNSISYGSPYIASSFDIKALSENELLPGDMVFLNEQKSDSRWRPTHYMIYLGKDIFLSTSGPGSGTLVAATLDAMKQAFSSPFAYRCTLKDDLRKQLE